MTSFIKLYQHVAMDENCLVLQKQEIQRECFCVYDKLITEMRNRLEAYSKVSEDFGFLSGRSLQKRTVADLENCAKDLGLKYSKDVNALEIVREIGSTGIFAKGAGIARYVAG
ncbi:unnamed protein product [Psylliodes chrysocephalus]|uniref:Uncharacterized protein n=1 Tax=Psylliodes chrysocephalus TaxID=3402493 RepID=A0A9P0DCA6_9CUCU|nr:unnamed protein product [Psylliodes chrysocephala]